VRAIGSAAAAVAIFVCYYWLLKDFLGVVSRRIVPRLPGGSKYTTKELYSVVKTVLGVTSQALLIVAVLIVFPSTRPTSLHLFGSIVLAPAGVLLGLAEMAASIIAAQYVLRIFDLVAARFDLRGASLPTQVWIDLSRAGWMGTMATIRKRFPRSLSISLVWAQVACEEAMFRHCFPLLIGGAPGRWVSAGLFVIMQMFGMPGWRSALFPVIGAAVMGVTHAYVYALSPFLLPLIIAHATSFFAASRTRQPPTTTRHSRETGRVVPR
jgi:hypothetical protein